MRGRNEAFSKPLAVQQAVKYIPLSLVKLAVKPLKTGEREVLQNAVYVVSRNPAQRELLQQKTLCSNISIKTI